MRQKSQEISLFLPIAMIHLIAFFDVPQCLPGCSPAKPSKRWPAAHYAMLANLMLENGALPVIIGTVDASACDEIARLCRCVNLMGKQIWHSLPVFVPRRMQLWATIAALSFSVLKQVR